MPLLTPSTQREGCSAPWWLRSRQAQPPQPDLSAQAPRLHLPWWCPAGVTCCSRSMGGARTGLNQALTSMGSGLRGSRRLIDFDVIYEKAKPAVVGECRWTAVFLIACIKKKKKKKMNWSVTYNRPQSWFLGSTMTTCWLFLLQPWLQRGGFDSFSVLSRSLDGKWKLHPWPLSRVVTRSPELIKKPPADPLRRLIFSLITKSTEVRF